MKNQKNAIILCSGGIDSVTTSFYVKEKLKYDKLKILFFNYNQKSLNAERKFSKLTAKNIKADFIEIKLNELSKLSTSLINIKGKSPKLSAKDLKDTHNLTNKYYVPARNHIFISYALALSDKLFIKSRAKQRSDIFLGFKCEGNNPYQDTTIEFVKQANKIAQATLSKPKILTPLIDLDKEDIINLAFILNINLKDTHSCYVNNKHCGSCLSCALRKAGFYWANQKDETEYLI
jgi:7-cyano-7-deazaguanine synthase